MQQGKHAVIISPRKLAFYDTPSSQEEIHLKYANQKYWVNSCPVHHAHLTPPPPPPAYM